jgi:hypothetical protein
MTKQETIDLLGKQLPGFYSVEQVIKMINDIEELGSFEISDEMVKTLSEDISEALSSEGTDIVDDYALSMNYGREVELDSIDLNESKIKAAIKDAIENYIDNNKADAE